MIEHKFLQVNGVRLHCAVAGQGRTILFVHGFPEFWYLWNNQLEDFGRDHHAAAVDLRGYNLSDKPPSVEDYAVKTLMADLKGLLHQLAGDEKAFLVAHDWGGAVAWSYAAAFPETLAGLIIINAPHPTVFLRELIENEDQQAASQYMRFFQTGKAEARLSANNFEALQQAVFATANPPEAFTEADRQAYLEAWAQPGALTGGLNFYRASEMGPPRNETEATAMKAQLAKLQEQRAFTVNVPTLVIWGMQDNALLPGNLEGLEDYVPDLEIERIDNATHWVVREQPDAVNRAIRSFLENK